MVIEIVKFLIYSLLIVIIAKLILVKSLRKLAENLNLKPRIVGNIAGVATSIPEFLTVTISSFNGLVGTSIYNIISSNIINFIQYVLSIIFNKNYKELKNKAIILQIILVIITIIIPIGLVQLEITSNIFIAVILIIMYFIFLLISNKVHKKYLKMEDYELQQQEEHEEAEERKNNKKNYVYIFYLLMSGILLYFIGDKLGVVLENLSSIFGIAEYILGILLGFITSIPELVTFFEAQKHYKNSEHDNFLGVVETTNNLLTSNMLNLFIIQAIGILIFIIIN